MAGAAIYVLAPLGYWAIDSVPGLLLWLESHGIRARRFFSRPGCSPAWASEALTQRSLPRWWMARRSVVGASVASFAACWELGVGGGTILVGRLAESAGFGVMLLLAATLPLIGLLGLSRLGGPHGPSPSYPPK